MNKIWLILLLASFSVTHGCSTFVKNHHAPPSNAMERLQSGNRRFVQHHARHPHQSAARIAETAAGQRPYAVVITCSDSRVSPEIIFDEGIGDLFVVRNAGNIVEEEDVLASVEYAVEHLGVRTVVVMGHEQCGAIEAMTHEKHEVEPAHIAAILQQLRDEPEEQKILAGPEKGALLIHKCVVANVEHGIAAMRQQLHHLESHSQGGAVSIIGAVYDIQTGVVHFLDIEKMTH